MIEVFKNIKIIPKFDTLKRLTMSDDQYFGTGLTNYISNSLLGLINPDQGGSPEKFLAGFSNQEYSSSLEIGTAVHGLILEPDKHQLSSFDKPTGKVGPIIENVYKLMVKGKHTIQDAFRESCIKYDYFSSSLTDNRLKNLGDKGADYLNYLYKHQTIVSDKTRLDLTKDNREKVIGTVKSIKTNKKAMDLLNPSDELFEIDTYIEDVITMDVEVDVDGELVLLHLKGKVDQWFIDSNFNKLVVNDLKTTGKPSEQFMGYEYHDASKYEKGIFLDGSFQKYHYYRQMAMYTWMLWNYCKLEHGITKGWVSNINMIVAETQSPHNSKVYRVNKLWMERGYLEFCNLIKRVAYHKRYGFDKVIE